MSANALHPEIASGARARPGKYLTFVLKNEEYGIEILKVREIIGMMDVTTVPRAPEFIKGVINLRGTIIPVVDLRLRFGLEVAAASAETCIIVVEVAVDGDGVYMGLLVDTVQEVIDIGEAEIEPPPRFGGGIRVDYILGMGKVKGRVKILLDIDRIMDDSEMAQLKNVPGN